MARPTKTLFAVLTRVGPGNDVLDAGPIPEVEGEIFCGKVTAHCKIRDTTMSYATISSAVADEPAQRDASQQTAKF